MHHARRGFQLQTKNGFVLQRARLHEPACPPGFHRQTFFIRSGFSFMRRSSDLCLPIATGNVLIESRQWVVASTSDHICTGRRFALHDLRDSSDSRINCQHWVIQISRRTHKPLPDCWKNWFESPNGFARNSRIRRQPSNSRPASSSAPIRHTHFAFRLTSVIRTHCRSDFSSDEIGSTCARFQQHIPRRNQ